MKKIYLFQVTQHNLKRYVGKASARELVRLATKVEMQAVQDAQRPISPKRLEEIASFVNESGTLSTSIVIGTTNDNLMVHKVESSECNDLYYMNFPSSESEFDQFQNSFDIMDGQHRLFSFLEEYVKLPENEAFEITFEMYLKPTMRDRRIIFKSTNEKQEKVASNLLMWFREKLQMLSAKEQTYHPVVALLNTEISSPLRGRIIMGAEKVTGGIKAQQVISILDKADIANLGNTPLDDSKMFHCITEYLIGWENAVRTKIVDRDAEFSAFSKISGLRFMIKMLPELYNYAVTKQKKFDADFVKETLDSLFANNGMRPEDIFKKDSNYIKNLGGNPFSAETPINELANEWSAKLKALNFGVFDPLA